MSRPVVTGAPVPDASATAVRVRVPAKINLALRVGPRRLDGYHDLATVFQAVDICDYLTATPAGATGSPGPAMSLDVGFTGGLDSSPVPADSTNLAWRAAVALADRAGISAAVALHLDKSIPVAGGMAGGSADAAAALVACDALWGLRTPAATLAELAAGLGSDVPFALRGGTAVGTGRGDQLRTVFGHGRFHWVVVPATGPGLSTPAVYAELDRLRPHAATPTATDVDDVVAACGSGSPHELAAALCNDLQAAALSLRPELAGVLARGTSAGALAGLVSGSGPTCVFLASSEPDAETIADHFDHAMVTSGPVAGAAQVT